MPVTLGIIGLARHSSCAGRRKYTRLLGNSYLRLSRRTTVLEKSTLHVLAFTALLALPTAIVVSIEAAEFAGPVQWVEAVRILPLAFLVPWGALAIPRVAIRRLKPGVFLDPTSRPAV